MTFLPYELPSLFTFEQDAGSPVIQAPEVGIRISARDVEYAQDVLRFELLVSCCFPRSYVQSFQRFSQALVFVLEDAAGGRATMARTIDPHKRYPAMSGPNFRKPPVVDAAPRSFRTNWMRVPLELPLPVPAWGPSFFVTVLLQEHVSNTLAFDLLHGGVRSFLGGRRHALLTASGIEDEDETPPDPAELFPSLPSAPPGDTSEPVPAVGSLTLTPRGAGPFSGNSAILLDATLVLPGEELAVGGAEAWLRSLFICSSHQATQFPRVGNWLGDRLVFPDDVRTRKVAGREQALISQSFALTDLLGGPLSPGTHYVQVSARQYRSNMVTLTCT
ncbi:hypothetical protein [Archangium gephyra]|nr:hypothetical protein [Archangium gephyra]